MNIPVAAVETGASPDSGSSGIEKSVEAAISHGNAPALVQAGTQLTQAATQRITSIATPDPNEASLPEQGVISAIASQATGLAQEAHRKYVNAISDILQSAPEPAMVAPPAAMPGFETRSVTSEKPLAPPSIEVHPIAIAAQVYLDERDEMDRVLNAAQVNYEGHSIKSAVPYYEAILAQDPSDQQWQAFVAALKMEHSFYETKRQRAELALKINQLQNDIEDNRKHNILPTAEHAEQLKQWQIAFEKANEDVSRLEQEKANAEAQYHSTQS